MRKALSVARAPLACVLVRARLNCTSGASVEAVRPVSAPPVSVRYGVAPLVRAAIESNSTGGSDCPTEE